MVIPVFHLSGEGTADNSLLSHEEPCVKQVHLPQKRKAIAYADLHMESLADLNDK